MLAISVKNLHDALTATPAYERPKLSDGVQYIHDKFMECCRTGIAPKLSDIDFSAFTLDDTDDFMSFNSDMCSHIHAVGQVAESFNKLKPIVVANTFI